MHFHQQEPAKARATLYINGNGKEVGTISFQFFRVGVTLITGIVKGLTQGKHGFHVHETSDFSNGCLSTKGHYNPHNKNHGAPDDAERHIGDLGNIVADENGYSEVSKADVHIQLSGQYSIVNRSVVVHAGEDDLGEGGHSDSKTTGNAGSRFACGVIHLTHVPNWFRNNDFTD